MKVWKWTLPVLVLGVATMFSVAAKSPAAHPAQQTLQTAVVLPHDTMTAKVRAFKKEWNKKIDQLGRKIDQEQQKLDKTTSKNKDKLKAEIRDMKTKRDELKKEVAAAGNKTAAQWDEFKDKVSGQYDALSAKVSDFFNGDD
jgi:Skp family chaperone for outer membrane proteins